MQKRKHKTVQGQGIDGSDRSYTFKLLTAEEGLEFFHSEEFHAFGMTLTELIKSLRMDEEGEPNGFAALSLSQTISSLGDWGKMKGIFAKFLAGAVIDYGEAETATLEDDGLCTYAQGDPVEQYVALAFAFFANFPTYSPFFEGFLAFDQEDGEKETGEPSQNTVSESSQSES
jgi:hypothetical protein